MSLSSTPAFPQKIQGWAVQLTNAIGTTITTLMSAGANGSIIESINCSLTDTTANGLQVYLNDGTTNHLLGTVTIPISSGNVAGTAAVDILRAGMLPGVPVDSNGNYTLFVPSGFSVKVAATAAPAATKVLDVVAMGADY